MVAEFKSLSKNPGYAKGFEEAFGIVFSRPGAARYYLASWTAILVRDVPYGTLQLVFFEFFKEFTPEYLEPLGFNLFAQRLVWGFLAGACAGPANSSSGQHLHGGHDRDTRPVGEGGECD